MRTVAARDTEQLLIQIEPQLKRALANLPESTRETLTEFLALYRDQLNTEALTAERVSSIRRAQGGYRVLDDLLYRLELASFKRSQPPRNTKKDTARGHATMSPIA